MVLVYFWVGQLLTPGTAAGEEAGDRFLMMEFHISGSARQRYQFEESLFSYTGNVVFANVAGCREFAYRMNQVREAHARLEQTKEQQFLLKEGIGLMVKDTLMGLDATRKSLEATGEAMKAATENRDLNTRAYENELVETQEVIKAQLIESLMTAQHLKNRFDYVAFQSQLTLLIGNEVWKQLHIGS